MVSAGLPATWKAHFASKEVDAALARIFAAADCIAVGRPDAGKLKAAWAAQDALRKRDKKAASKARYAAMDAKAKAEERVDLAGVIKRKFTR